MRNLLCFFVCLFSACSPTKMGVYRLCKEQVEVINKMRLNVAYLVPVDSLGKYMNDELISYDMFDRCEVVANINPNEVHALAMLYFDTAKRVRKSIEWWSDGGDLRNVAYYDEQGHIIYAVYDYYDNNCGRLYAIGSKRYIEHPSEDSNNGDGISFPALNTSELASRYKARFQMPDRCNIISFVPIQKGDRAFLCTNRIYAIPRKEITRSEETRWGGLAFIDSVAGDWCSISTPTSEKPIGYVLIDSLELGIKK